MTIPRHSWLIEANRRVSELQEVTEEEQEKSGV